MWTPHLLILNALRVFHAAARHEDFRTAADELLVSPQAVSQRIKILDYALGVALVERVGSGISSASRG